MYIIQASPLTRIYMTEWSHALVEDPELIFKSDPPFDVTIPRTAGAVKLTHNKPVHSSSLIPVTGLRKLDGAGDELRDLVSFLTESAETHIYGVVALNLNLDMTDALTYLATLDPEEAAKKIIDAQKVLANSMREAITAARATADERVKMAMRTTHRNLKKQWQEMEQAGQGKYDPSAAEAVGAYVLQSEIARVATADLQKQKLMEGAMSAMGANLGGKAGVQARGAAGYTRGTTQPAAAAGPAPLGEAASST